MSQLLSVSSFLSSALYIILAILVLLLMVTIHELGHYIAGKLLKFKINEFAVGFGKVLYSKTNKAGEKISLRLFPLGGFCAFEDEDGTEGTQSAQSFIKQKPWKRLIVLFMGPFFNLIAAVFFSFIFLMAYGYKDVVQVTEVDSEFRGAAGVELETDWFMEGDVILAVDGERTSFISDKYFSYMAVNFDEGEEYEVLVKRNGEEKTLVVSSAYKPIASRVEEGKNDRFYAINGKDYIYKVYAGQEGKLVLSSISNTDNSFVSDENGVWVINDVKIRAVPVTDGDVTYYDLGLLWGGIDYQEYKYGFFEAIGQSFVFAFGWAWKVLVILWGLITGSVSLTGVGGPITTITTIASATQMNFANFFLLLPLISANLGIFNLLPFPALDGARMVFVGLEGIFRKPVVSRNVEAYIHFGGIIILMAFVIIIDIIHFLV